MKSLNSSSYNSVTWPSPFHFPQSAMCLAKPCLLWPKQVWEAVWGSRLLTLMSAQCCCPVSLTVIKQIWQKREADLCGAVKRCHLSVKAPPAGAHCTCTLPQQLCCSTAAQPKQLRVDWEAPTALSGDDVLRRKHRSSQRRQFLSNKKGEQERCLSPSARMLSHIYLTWVLLVLLTGNQGGRNSWVEVGGGDTHQGFWGWQREFCLAAGRVAISQRLQFSLLK